MEACRGIVFVPVYIMQTKLIWEGIEYNSVETCFIESTVQAVNIYSTIVGSYREKNYNLIYRIKTNTAWETVSVDIDFRCNETEQIFTFESDAKGKWFSNGKQLDQFNGCIDVDIPLTPFTNTLPIKRLRMEEHSPQKIKVLYIDLLDNQITALNQLYEKRSVLLYHYENIPNDFEADIEVDENGFVLYYPSLFKRKEDH